jgi:hypothetical protein
MLQRSPKFVRNIGKKQFKIEQVHNISGERNKMAYCQENSLKIKLPTDSVDNSVNKLLRTSLKPLLSGVSLPRPQIGHK